MNISNKLSQNSANAFEVAKAVEIPRKRLTTYSGLVATNQVSASSWSRAGEANLRSFFETTFKRTAQVGSFVWTLIARRLRQKSRLDSHTMKPSGKSVYDQSIYELGMMAGLGGCCPTFLGVYHKAPCAKTRKGC